MKRISVILLAVVMSLVSSHVVWAGTRTITVTGTVDDSQATVTVNGVMADVSDGTFSVEITLTEGKNTIEVIATDLAKNSTSASVEVTLDTVPPVIVITSPEEGQLFGAK